MKNLKISHTIYPSGNRREYQDGKPMTERAVNTIGFNNWTANVVRNGGVCYGEMSALDQAKKLLLTPRR